MTIRKEGTNKCIRFKCPSEFTFEPRTKKCIKRVCPDSTYVWDAEVKKCVFHRCEDKSFVFNSSTKLCEKKECKDKTFTYNPKTDKCEKQTCEPGFIFDATNGKCVKVYCKNGYVLDMMSKTPKCILIKTVAEINLFDPSDLTLTNNLNKMMLWFGQLENRTMTDIFGCELNLQPARTRCENDHGKDGCQQMTPTMFNKKCPAGMKNMGNSMCVSSCPNEWQFDDEGLYCRKKHSYRVDTFKTLEECRNNKWWTSCVSTADNLFVPICKENYAKTGSTLCRPSCPAGWSDLGTMCVKPSSIDVGIPYTWANGDN